MDHDHGMSGFCVKPRGGAAGGGGGGGVGGAKCGRWNPTAEQVKVLTDLFRSGLRTPSTDQIQKISSQLSFYGKIESKNVFYWFQNHKARERQKRRRVSLPDHHQHHDQSCREDKVSSAKQPNSVSQRKFFTDFVDSNQISDPAGRVIETLQLFPLSSFGESGSDKLRRLYSSDFKEVSETDHHPPLDLRLSFM